MGLDSYAMVVRSLNAAENAEFEKVKLCGGMFSGEGGSFRGKVYNRIIEELTGESLYQEFISPPTVLKMYEELRDNHRDLVNDGIDGDMTEEESTKDADSLIEFFRICAERGYALHGWW